MNFVAHSTWASPLKLGSRANSLLKEVPALCRLNLCGFFPDLREQA